MEERQRLKWCMYVAMEIRTPVRDRDGRETKIEVMHVCSNGNKRIIKVHLIWFKCQNSFYDFYQQWNRK